MAKFLGKVAELDIMDSAGTAVSLALACNIGSDDGIGIDLSADNVEVTQLCDGDKEFIAGLREGTLSFKLLYDDGTFSGSPQKVVEDLFLAGTTRSLKWRPNGTGTGKPEYSFSGFFTSLSVVQAGGDPVGADCEVQISGAITRATQA